MKMESVAADLKFVKNRNNLIDIVDCALDGCTDVGRDDDGSVRVGGDSLLQEFVVDFSVGGRWDGLHIHSKETESLEGGEVRLPAGKDDTIGESFPGEQETVHVTFRSPGCDVSPISIL